MSGAPTFAMFCTHGGGCYLFAEVADEIEAVRAYSTHVESFKGSDHRPYIHMEPMRAEWTFNSFLSADDLDPARNLFRQPAEAAPCV